MARLKENPPHATARGTGDGDSGGRDRGGAPRGLVGDAGLSPRRRSTAPAGLAPRWETRDSRPGLSQVSLAALGSGRSYFRQDWGSEGNCGSKGRWISEGQSRGGIEGLEAPSLGPRERWSPKECVTRDLAVEGQILPGSLKQSQSPALLTADRSVHGSPPPPPVAPGSPSPSDSSLGSAPCAPLLPAVGAPRLGLRSQHIGGAGQPRISPRAVCAGASTL